MGKLKLIIPLVLSVVLAFSLNIFIAIAQESLPIREDRLFEKNDISLNLDSITYTDGKVLYYDIINPPISKVIVHNWDKLSALSKTSIYNTLTAQGYSDKGSYNPDPIRDTVVNQVNKS